MATRTRGSDQLTRVVSLSVLATALGIAYGSAKVFGVSYTRRLLRWRGARANPTSRTRSRPPARPSSAWAAAQPPSGREPLPLRDAFAVLFFVSVGMLLNPMILVPKPLQTLTVLLIIIVVKSLPAIGIVLAFRHPIGTASGYRQVFADQRVLLHPRRVRRRVWAAAGKRPRPSSALALCSPLSPSPSG